MLERDCDLCRYCGVGLIAPVHVPGKRSSGRTRSYDHVVPKSKGGRWTVDNLVLACQTCNLRKGDRTPDEAKMPLLPAPVPAVLVDV